MGNRHPRTAPLPRPNETTIISQYYDILTMLIIAYKRATLEAASQHINGTEGSFEVTHTDDSTQIPIFKLRNATIVTTRDFDAPLMIFMCESMIAGLQLQGYRKAVHVNIILTTLSNDIRLCSDIADLLREKKGKLNFGEAANYTAMYVASVINAFMPRLDVNSLIHSRGTQL